MIATRKDKFFAALLLLIVGGLLIYTWATILFTEIVATWKHYFGLLLFLPLPFLYLRNFRIALFAAGFYFLLGTFNLFSLTPSTVTDSFGFKVGTLQIGTPDFQPLLLGLLTFYLFINYNSFLKIYIELKHRNNENR